MTLGSLGDLLGIGEIALYRADILMCPATVFCVVGVINAVNLIDGLDGLAGGIALVSFMTFAVHAWLADAGLMLVINLLFGGGVLGFLMFNWHPARVFLGDAGSLCLGFTLSLMAIVMSQGDRACFSPVVPLIVLAIPITDTITVMTRRMLNGRNPFKADRHHLHHILMRFGLGSRSAVVLILASTMLLGGCSVMAEIYGIPDSYMFCGYMVFFSGYFLSSFFILPLILLCHIIAIPCLA